jgi:23S rRNA G2445 N2-methylase RlmL
MLALAAQARGETAENPSDPAGANAGEAEVAGIESAGADRAGTQLPGGEALGSLLDPFCGSGTIAVEAAAVLPQAGIVAADKREEAVEGTRANLKALGLTERIGVMQMDARDLDDHFSEESMDAIVTNPPFGVRLHKEADFRRLYERFLRTAHTILTPGGVIVMLVGKKRGLFNKLLRELALYDLLDVRIIEIGGVYPGIFVLRKRGES